MRGICGAAIVLVFAEEVSERVICVAAIILVSAEEVSVRRICVAAVILVFAEEVSVRGICGSATVRNRLCVRRKALHSGERVWSGLQSVSS